MTMSSTIIQGGSFLDHAWASSFSVGPPAAKPHKKIRKQRRSCDQCRKGKRACNAAILEDGLLNANDCRDDRTGFHYSDAFGPLAPCGNCSKMRKTCTFDWLRSQRMLQVDNQRIRTTRSAKQGEYERSPMDALEHGNNTAWPTTTTPKTQSDIATGLSTESFDNLGEWNMNLVDPTFELSGFDMYSSEARISDDAFASPNDEANEIWNDSNGAPQEDRITPTSDLGKDRSSKTTTEETSDEHRTQNWRTLCSTTRNIDKPVYLTELPVARAGQKRRRRQSSSGSILSFSQFEPLSSFDNDLFSSSVNAFIREGLLKIYHDSFENALSCWLVEQNCPYCPLTAGNSSMDDAYTDWNRMYARVFQLDRITFTKKGKQICAREDQAASKALNLAIFSFATQWAQGSHRSKAKSTFQEDEDESLVREPSKSRESLEYDRALQISAWHEARRALQNAGSIESFRVVLAHLVFALTQEPIETENIRKRFEETCSSRGESTTESACFSTEDKAPHNRDDLLLKLTLVFDAEGPPVYLEHGLRLIHSMRSRMRMSRATSRASPETFQLARHNPSSPVHLDATSHATIDLLFWLGVMFDTLSSVIHNRPLVVSDEDSDNRSNGTSSVCDSNEEDTRPDQISIVGGLWDHYMFDRRSEPDRYTVLRWPCSYDKASTLLRDAAPVKVLLFRKIARIQSLLARNIISMGIERSIKAALDVYKYWEQSFLPFLRDCMQNHNFLPPRIQSWYICLAGHWHLGTLLLADLIEIIDECKLSVEANRLERDSSAFVMRFRTINCQILSDLAKATCPPERDTTSFSQCREFHFAVNPAALLTEPWTAVLIRAFAKAGAILLESLSKSPLQNGQNDSRQDILDRTQDCTEALWFLGRKSDIAMLAATILRDSWKQHLMQ